ncbi:hypothetical protein [Caenispirillum bisanense]|uniref:hypothetical protein n=1 Tax=Caenispirillum bisanense TaxID=414052 RepID=UPI0031D41934
MPDITAIQDVVETVLREQFGDADVHVGAVSREQDWEGGPLLRINILFDNGGRILNPRTSSGLVRHIWPRLSNLGEDAFPVLYYLDRRQAEGAGTEAA